VDRLYPFTVTTPASTAIGAPQSTPLPLEDARLVQVTIIVPDGHAGLTGIRLLQASQQIIPWSNLDYIIANNRIVTIPVDGEITGTGLVAVTYNSDVFIHNHYLEVLIRDLPLPVQPGAASQTGPAIVTDTAAAVVDPLSPAALLASLPAEMQPSPDVTGLAV